MSRPVHSPRFQGLPAPGFRPPSAPPSGEPPPEPPDPSPPPDDRHLSLGQVALCGLSAASAIALPAATVQAPPPVLELRLAVNRPYQLPTVESWHPPVDESERTPSLVQAQESAIQQALTSQDSRQFPSSEGAGLSLRMQGSSGNYLYTLQGCVPVRVTFLTSTDPARQVEILSQLIDYQSQVPLGFGNLVREVVLTEQPPGSTTEAQSNAAQRRLTFFGLGSVNETNYTHEIGHLVGSRIEREDDSFWQVLMARAEPWLTGHDPHCPDNWAELVQQEAPLSTYSKDGLAEDFAESWTAYTEARESGPAALEQLRARYPLRFAAVESIWERGQDARLAHPRLLGWLRGE